MAVGGKDTKERKRISTHIILLKINAMIDNTKTQKRITFHNKKCSSPRSLILALWAAQIQARQNWKRGPRTEL